MTGRGGRNRAVLLLTTVLLSLGAADLMAQDGDTGAFVMLMGADTFAVEKFSRTAERLTGEMTGRSFGRVEYELVAGESVSRSVLTLRAWLPGAADGGEPSQVATIRVNGTAARAEIGAGAGARTQEFSTTEGALMYLNPSFAIMEEAVRRVRASGDPTSTVPLLFVQGGQTMEASISRVGDDSVAIVMGGSAMRAAVDGEGRILGAAVDAQNLRVLRVDGGAVESITTQPPDYSAPDGAAYTAEEVVIETAAGHRLAGTLTLPTGLPAPAVVMITGSGPQDRDQAIPTVAGYRPFRQFADALSSAGIAVLRLDDRGTGASTGDFGTATSADFADDIRSALDHLRGRSDIDGARLGLVGHSEGGLIAPLVAANDPALRAIVLIAAPARTRRPWLREIIHFQQRFAIESSPAIPVASRDSAVAAARVQLDSIAATQPWLRFFLDHDPLRVAGTLDRVPVLILHGETDRQVTAEQAADLAEAFRSAGNPDVTVRVFEGLNHLMVPDPDGNPAGYATLPDRSVAREVLDELVDWTTARLR
jgi:uncharacterized protein